MVAAGIADEVLVQVAYAIGVARPVGIFVNTYGTSKVSMDDGAIADKIEQIFDLRPAAIVKRLGLKNPVFRATSAYGHMGRKPETREVEFQINGNAIKKQVEFFAWEKLDYVDELKNEFNID
jgi:S-adenosylmethionine synthetase